MTRLYDNRSNDTSRSYNMLVFWFNETLLILILASALPKTWQLQLCFYTKLFGDVFLEHIEKMTIIKFADIRFESQSKKPYIFQSRFKNMSGSTQFRPTQGPLCHAMKICVALYSNLLPIIPFLILLHYCLHTTTVTAPPPRCVSLDYYRRLSSDQ